MLTTTDLQNSVSMMVSPSPEDHLEVSRLLAAAVVNPSFSQLLLVDPKQAIENGYPGETFQFSDAARYLLMLIRADSLVELAQQIAQTFGIGLNKQSSSFARQPVPINC
jgi:hypothetical protein